MNSIEPNFTSSKEQISILACRLWEQAGRPSGRDLEFWLKAETELFSAAKTSLVAMATDAKPATPRVKGKKK